MRTIGFISMEEADQIVIVYNYWTEFADEEQDVGRALGHTLTSRGSEA